VEKFLIKNKLKTKTPDNLELSRFQVGTTGSVKLWFEKFKEAVPDYSSIDPRMIFNMDQTMIDHNSKIKGN
jgi:hypothetical protein